MTSPLVVASLVRLALLCSILAVVAGFAGAARAEGVVRLPLTGDRCADDPRCHNRWHHAIEPVARARPGDTVAFATRDAFDHALDRESTPADVVAINLNLVHPLTGPLFVEGAEPGDVLAVTLLDIEPDRFGYTIVVPGFGFLRDVFTEPFIVRWDLTRGHATSPDLPGVRIRFDGFMGTIGVAPGPAQVETFVRREAALAEAGGFVLLPEPLDARPPEVCGPQGSHRNECLRTIPPRENGGNMDVKQMQKGTTLLLPCFVRGCLLSIGDVHYAQGDGEVSGTAIEMDATVVVRLDLRKGLGRTVTQPHFEGGNQLKRLAPERFYATVGFPLKDAGGVPATHAWLDGERIASLTNLSEDVTLAARNALLQMVEWLVQNRGLTPEQAYVLASVAVDLRIAQLVDTPNVAVSAILDLGVFERQPPSQGQGGANHQGRR